AIEMNLSDAQRIRILTVQRAVVYDCDPDRAERVAEVLKEVDLEPLLIDHDALMRAVIQSPMTPPALLIGDPGECDWVELGRALREQLGDVPVVSYGSSAVANQLIEAIGAARVRRLPFPFQDRKSTRLNSSHVKLSYAVCCLQHPAAARIDALSLLAALPISDDAAGSSHRRSGRMRLGRAWQGPSRAARRCSGRLLRIERGRQPAHRGDRRRTGPASSVSVP